MKSESALYFLVCVLALGACGEDDPVSPGQPAGDSGAAGKRISSSLTLSAPVAGVAESRIPGTNTAVADTTDSDPVVGDNNGDQRTEEGDRSRLAEMRGEIDALVGDAAGASIEDCRYVGLGSKPCGGPWEYVVYSASSTDSTALAERMTAYKAFEADMNERYGYGSDCSVPNEPVLAFRDGRCVAE